MENRIFNKWFLAAGAMMAAIAAIHAFAGGPQINAPVQASDLPPMIRAVSAVIWHALTGLFLVLAVALAWASLRADRGIVWLSLGLCAVFAGVFMVAGWLLLGYLTTMPQWTLFAATGAVLGVGLSRQQGLAEARG